MPSFSTACWAAAFLLTSLQVTRFGVSAQNCYYPNGDLSTEGDTACSSDGGACCPLNWECMSNGLCYLESAGFYGRYTCTDQTWQSSSCPQICTESNTASGNEALLWCSSGEWCCDGNRSWNCCTTADTNYFSLPQPSSIAFISTTAAPTSASSVQNSAASSSEGAPASSSNTNSQGKSAVASSGASSSPSPTGSSDSSTSTSGQTRTTESTTTGSDGSISTITSLITAAAATSEPSNNAQTHATHKSSSGLSTGEIVGLALGIPLALLILGIATFALYRHHRKTKRRSYISPPRSPPLAANYNEYIIPGSHAPELDSSPVATGRTKSGRKSELQGSEAYSPASSTGTGPPKYSPDGTSSQMAQIPEEPQELWGGYVPYRPPKPAKVDADVEGGAAAPRARK